MFGGVAHKNRYDFELALHSRADQFCECSTYGTETDQPNPRSLLPWRRALDFPKHAANSIPLTAMRAGEHGHAVAESAIVRA
jgi:hypothetical protein